MNNFDINSVIPWVKKILTENKGGYIPSDILMHHWKVSKLGWYCVSQGMIEELQYKVRVDTLNIIYNAFEDVVHIVSNQIPNINNLDINDPIWKQIILAVWQANMILFMYLQTVWFKWSMTLSTRWNPINDRIEITQASELIQNLH